MRALTERAAGRHRRTARMVARQGTSVTIDNISADGSTAIVEWTAEIGETSDYQIEVSVGAGQDGPRSVELYSGQASWGTTIARETTFDLNQFDSDQFVARVAMTAPSLLTDSATFTSEGGSGGGGFSLAHFGVIALTVGGAIAVKRRSSGN